MRVDLTVAYIVQGAGGGGGGWGVDGLLSSWVGVCEDRLNSSLHSPRFSGWVGVVSGWT